MKKITIILLLLISTILAGCRLIPSQPAPQPTITSTASPDISPTTTPAPTNTPNPTATQTATATPAPDFTVRVHPDGGLYVGDQVSFEILLPKGVEVSASSKLAVIVDGKPLDYGGYNPFGYFGIGGRYQATLPWVWDTSDMQAGDVPVTFSIEPENITWQETVTLHPAAQVPPPEPKVRWAHEESDCCLFYYITNTEGARDIESITKIADHEAEQVSSQMKTDFSEPVIVNLIPRVLGHGGFAWKEISISYLDRNFAGNDLGNVLHHEMVHILDERSGKDTRPTIFVEGLAVYLTGGHFKKEPLIPRAAALLDPKIQENGLGMYIPLKELADDFYHSQHEIGYLEAASLVEYLVDTYGRDAFFDFYHSTDLEQVNESKEVTYIADSKAIDSALQEHFKISFRQLEKDFIEHLINIDVDPRNADDVRLLVDYYNIVRQYEQILDPSAYFLNAWMPDLDYMRQSGIVADYVRHPATPENIAVEAMMMSAHTLLLEKNYEAMETVMDALHKTLGAFEQGKRHPFESSPLANDYYQITRLMHDNGLVVQTITIENDKATVIATTGWADEKTYSPEKKDGNWVLPKTDD